MCWNLYYLKIVDDEKVMKFERNFEKGELALIEECNQILGNFNSFCDYYTMLINSLKELKDYIKKIETSEYRITSPFEKKHTIVETNIRVVDFIGMFKNYLDYYEVQVKHVYGEKSDELKDFKRKCSSFFDKYFEYIFLYNLRHYSVHYRLPVTKVISKFEDKKRTFYIEKDKLKEWSGWKATIKKDINKDSVENKNKKVANTTKTKKAELTTKTKSKTTSGKKKTTNATKKGPTKNNTNNNK